MLIIGDSKDGYIISATKDEVANLVGYYGKYTDGFSSMNLKVGCQIKISEMYNQLRNLSFKEEELEEVRKILSGVINNLNTIDPIIPPINVP